MIRRLSIVLLLALVAAPALAQNSLEGDLRTARAHYPARNLTPAQQAALLNEVAWNHQTEGWGLLLKPGGNNCPLPSGTLVSCDYLVFAPNGQGFDVLQDAEGAANVTWSRGDVFDRSRWVAPEKPAGAPDPPVVHPPTTDPGDEPDPFDELVKHFDDLTARLAETKAEMAELRARLDVVNGKLDQALAKPWPTYTTTLFGQRVTLTPK